MNRIQEDGQNQLVGQVDEQGDGQGVQGDRPGSQICQQCQELCAHGIEQSCKDCLNQWTIMVLGQEGKQQDVGQGAQEDQPFVQICQRCTGICANELGKDCQDCINDLYQWMEILEELRGGQGQEHGNEEPNIEQGLDHSDDGQWHNGGHRQFDDRRGRFDKQGGLIPMSYWQDSCLFDCIKGYQNQYCQNCLRRIRENGDHLI